MPSSNQNPVGNSKAAKFVAANPLGPMADPFSGLGNDENTEVRRYSLLCIVFYTYYTVCTVIVFVYDIIPISYTSQPSTTLNINTPKGSEGSIRKCTKTIRKGNGGIKGKARFGYERKR